MKLGILLSGRGSNMMALVRAVRDRRIDGEVALVLSDRSDSPGLAWAKTEGLDTACLPRRDHPDREGHDRAILDELRKHHVELVCLAGYMRLLSPVLVQAFPERLLNVHPSLLPAFPGLDAQRQAFEHGARVTGATVHLVDEELDHGPIVLQEAVTLLAGDTAETLAARILEVEHRLYPRAVQLICQGRISLDGRRVVNP